MMSVGSAKPAKLCPRRFSQTTLKAPTNCLLNCPDFCVVLVHEEHLNLIPARVAYLESIKEQCDVLERLLSHEAKSNWSSHAVSVLYHNRIQAVILQVDLVRSIKKEDSWILAEVFHHL